jgi:hypothetical protein
LILVKEILDVTIFVAGVFDRLGIAYLVGGSLASSLHGIPRATQDADVVAAIQPGDVRDLVAALQETFYLDEDTIRRAVRERSSFNIVHLETLLKVDVFVARQDNVSEQQMQRRQTFTIDPEARRELVVASPEDVVAQKLYWYRLGDEVSERQWSDAVGVLKVRSGRLDMDYLRRTARLLGVGDLLARACQMAGLPGPEDGP